MTRSPASATHADLADEFRKPNTDQWSHRSHNSSIDYILQWPPY